MLDILARIRNVCAHNERLFNYRYKKGAINDTFMKAGSFCRDHCAQISIESRWAFPLIGQILKPHLWEVILYHKSNTFARYSLT